MVSPKFQQFLKSVLAEVGKEAAFECQIHGEPAPVITWYVRSDPTRTIATVRPRPFLLLLFLLLFVVKAMPRHAVTAVSVSYTHLTLPTKRIV